MGHSIAREAASTAPVLDYKAGWVGLVVLLSIHQGRAVVHTASICACFLQHSSVFGHPENELFTQK